MKELEFFSIGHLIKTGLPPLPGSVMRVSALLSDINVSQRKIADAISLDPILSSRILRIANSPIYSLRENVTNLGTAVTAIGNSSISQTITISGVSDAFGRRVLSSPAGQEIWAHSIAVAMAATEICRVARITAADEAFSCGLLHDIGKLILLRADAPLYKKLLADVGDGDLTALERETFGFDHAELGAAAAESWNLPAPVVNLIKFHHQPLEATSGFAVTYVLHTADRLVNLKTANAATDELYNEESVITFGLKVDQFDEIWQTVLLRLKEILATLA